MSVVRAVTIAILLVVVLSLFNPANVLSQTLMLYVPVLVLLATGAALLHRGKVDFVGWGVSLLVWATVSLGLFLFGGLRGHNAMSFVVAMTIAGTIVGGRAAIAVGLLSIATAVVVYLLERDGGLPTTLAPLSAPNSLIAITVSILLSGWMLALSLLGMERALANERAASKERDLAHAHGLRAQRLESVGRLAAGVAHDLSNMLSIVQLTADELHVRAAATPELKPLVDDLRQASDQASLLSRRMVGMSRARGSPLEQLEVGAVAQNFAPLLRKLLSAETQLQLHLRTPLHVSASASAIEHVLLNLVVNARDAMPNGGPIDIIVEGRELLVRDAGVGMSAEVQSKLFTPFFTTRGKGTGLGLANVAELAASMKATVTVQSEPGKGSTFKIAFPA